MREFKVTTTVTGIYKNPANEKDIFNGTEITADIELTVQAESREDATQQVISKIAEECRLGNTGYIESVIGEDIRFEPIAVLGKPISPAKSDWFFENRDTLVQNMQEEMRKALDEIDNGYAVLQLKDSDSRLFSSYTKLRNGDMVTFADYDILAVTETFTEQRDRKRDIADIAEDVYTKYSSNNRPYHFDGFYGRRMSVSDVVVIKQDGQMSALYCTNFGFSRLDKDFFDTNKKKNKSIDMDR